MAEPQTFTLDAPGLAKLTDQIAALLRQDAQLRALQGQFAQQAKYFDQPGVASSFGGTGTVVTGAVLYRIQEIQTRSQEKFSTLVLVFETTSGSGRWRIDGAAPTPTIGTQVPAGGIVLTIPGYENIKNFQLMAEATQTLVFSRYLFN